MVADVREAALTEAATRVAVWEAEAEAMAAEVEEAVAVEMAAEAVAAATGRK